MYTNRLIKLENRLKNIKNRLANLQNANPDLVHKSCENYNNLVESHKNACKTDEELIKTFNYENKQIKQIQAEVIASPSETGFNLLKNKCSSLEKISANLSATKNKISALNNEIMKYKNNECIEYLNLLQEKDDTLNLINDIQNRTNISCYEPSNITNGRALKKVDLISNLDNEWREKFCIKHNLI